MTKTEMTILTCLMGSVANLSSGMRLVSEPKPYTDVMDGRHHKAALALMDRGLTVVEEQYPRKGMFTCWTVYEYYKELARRKEE